jgi:hypothetical protein
MSIEADARAAVDAASGTGPQPAHAAPQPRTTMGVVHRDLVAVGHAVTRAVPVLEAIAVNPLIDELVAEALEALHAGGLEPVLQAAVDSLRAARLRQSAGMLPAPVAQPEGGA